MAELARQQGDAGAGSLANRATGSHRGSRPRRSRQQQRKANEHKIIRRRDVRRWNPWGVRPRPQAPRPDHHPSRVRAVRALPWLAVVGRAVHQSLPDPPRGGRLPNRKGRRMSAYNKKSGIRRVTGMNLCAEENVYREALATVGQATTVTRRHMLRAFVQLSAARGRDPQPHRIARRRPRQRRPSPWRKGWGMSTRAVVAAVIAAACLTPCHRCRTGRLHAGRVCARRGERVTELRQHQRRRHPY